MFEQGTKQKGSHPQNKVKRKKISRKMSKKLAIIIVASNLLLLFVVGTAVKDSLRGKETSYIAEIVSNISNNISATLTEYVAIADIIAMNPDVVGLLEESSSSRPMEKSDLADRVVEISGGIQSQFPAILNVGVCSVAEDSYLLHNGDVSGSSFSFKTRSYFSVVTTKQSMITAPYIDDATGALVITMASPILSSNGTAIGGIFVDLSVDFIADLIQNSHFGESGSSFIIDSTGILVACEETSKIGQNYSVLNVSGNNLDGEIASPTKSLIEFQMNGETRMGEVGLMPTTGWRLVSSLDVDEYNAESNSLLTTLIYFLVASAGVTLVSVGVIVNLSLRPIDEIKSAMHQLSQGNTHFDFDFTSDDEIGGLADDLRFTVNNLADYIDEINRQLACCSQGDFTVRSDMEFLGDFAQIQHSIRDFTVLISEALNGMKETVEQVSMGSDYVASGSQNLAEGSMKQSDSVSILNENLEEITKSVNENVENVKYVNESSHKAAEELVKNNGKMDLMVKSMEDINRSSEGIQKIIKTIQDVAFQTNILALNAAVEAARAGTAGRGFAVVAEEVRNLSTRTSVAVEETTALIEETVAAVKSGNTVVEETAKGLNDVIEFVGSFMGTLSDITVASENQAMSIEEISRNVNEITNVMQQNSAISEESAATSEELSSQASVMNSTIAQFKTTK